LLLKTWSAVGPIRVRARSPQFKKLSIVADVVFLDPGDIRNGGSGVRFK
jgi:hypothetical protein